MTYMLYALYMPTLDYPTISSARANLREIYDSAEGHVPAVLRRDGDQPVAVVLRDDLLRALRALCPMDPQVRFSPTGRVSMWIDGLPVSAEGADLAEAEQELVAAARDYAITWVEELRRFANHEPNWGPVNLILLSDDTQLRSHLFGDD